MEKGKINKKKLRFNFYLIVPIVVFIAAASILTGVLIFNKQARLFYTPHNNARKPVFTKPIFIVSHPEKPDLIAPDFSMHRTLSYGDKGKNVIIAQDVLSNLGYLPVKCEPWYTGSKTSCHWIWKWKNIPPQIRQLWKPSVFTLVLLSAVMKFQYENKLPVTGVINKTTWKNIINDYRQKRGFNNQVISYAWVNKKFPKTIHLWLNGRNAAVSLANTGIPTSPTNNGIFYVYLRFYDNTMKGITPWKKRYKDKNIPFINYFNGGEAIHGFPRGIYGVNQSLGCIELPLPIAWIFWKNLNYGTPVIILKNPQKEPLNKSRPSKFHIRIFSHKLSRLKFLYVDHSLTFTGIPVASLNLFSPYKDSFISSPVLTTDVQYGADIGLIERNSKKDIFFSDTKNLKGTYIRSIYYLKIHFSNFPDPTEKKADVKTVKTLMTIEPKKTGIISNIAVSKNNSLWFILYSYAGGKYKNYLYKIPSSSSPSGFYGPPRKMALLYNNTGYLKFDANGNLWLSGFKFTGKRCINYIKEIRLKYLHENSLKNKNISTIYSMPGYFCGSMPVLPTKTGNIWILKHGYTNAGFKNYIIKIEHEYLKNKNGKPGAGTGIEAKNIASFAGYVGNIALNKKRELFVIDTILKKGIFRKRLFEIKKTDKNKWSEKKILSFYGPSNGIATDILFLKY